MVKWNKYSTRKKPDENRMVLLQRRLDFKPFGSDTVYTLLWITDKRQGTVFTSEGNWWRDWKDWSDTAAQWVYLDELLKEGGLQ